MIRRRSFLKVSNLTTFFFSIIIKKNLRNFLKKNRNLFFLKRKKLFNRKRVFLFFNNNYIFKLWQVSSKNCSFRTSNFITDLMSLYDFRWYGFILQKTNFFITFKFFFFSFIFYMIKLKKSLNNLFTINSFFFNKNFLPFSKKTLFNYFISNYLFVIRRLKTSTFLSFDIRKFLPLYFNFYVFYNLLIFYVFF